MAANLVSCPACARHVRRSEQSCPFCGEDVREALARAPAPPSGPRPLTRAGLLLAGAAAAAACGKEPKPPADAGGTMVVNPYGVPIFQDSGVAPPPPRDLGTAALPAYGPAPPIAVDGGNNKKK